MKKFNNIYPGWDLQAKYLAGEASPEEKNLVESWINESENNFREFNQNREIFEKTGLYYQSTRFNESSAFASVKSKINNEVEHSQDLNSPGRKIYLRFLRYAAVIILVVAAGFSVHWLGTRSASTPKIENFSTANKEIRREVALPDGSLVTLNGNTTIFYPSRFNAKTREVEIKGEAFFDVKPDPGRPFIIKAGNTNITVLGTSFNVSAYPNDETVEVVVETGRVQVTGQSTNPEYGGEVLLSKGEKATFSKKDKTLQKKTNDDPNYLGWKTQTLVYTKAPLEYVIQNLKKTYQVEIDVSDPEIEKLVLTASFNNKSIDFILDVIRLTFNLELSTENNRYILIKRNS
jgi:transmembrane sensor